MTFSRLPRGVARAVAALLLACLALSTVQTAQAQSDRRGFLFEVRKGTQSALLFGTIHVGRPEFYPLPEARLAR